MQAQGQSPSLSGLHSLTLVLAMYLDVPTSSCISQLSPRSCLQSAEHLRPLQGSSLFLEFFPVFCLCSHQDPLKSL